MTAHIPPRPLPPRRPLPAASAPSCKHAYGFYHYTGEDWRYSAWLTESADASIGTDGEGERFNFCPRCGADLRQTEGKA